MPEGQPVIGDWTGNGMMRIGVFHDGTWFLDLNGNRRWDGKNGGDGVFSSGCLVISPCQGIGLAMEKPGWGSSGVVNG